MIAPKPMLALVVMLLATTVVPARLPATGRDDIVADPAIAGPAWTETGAWRTRVQQVFDPATRTLARRLYTAWDPEPARALDFVWSPEDAASGRPGRINGTGHLLWRLKDKPTYERASLVAEYRGTLRDGRMEGQGAYLDHTGLLYVGQWRNGWMDGHGTLTLPGGDEYVGRFRAGKAHGVGRYTDVPGEVYEGPFVGGFRHGRGTTTLPNGRQYASLWSMGREAQASQRVRLVQAPGKPLPGGTDDIRIGITVDKRLPQAARDESNRDGDLFYGVSNTSGGLLIQPDRKDLMAAWKGGGNIANAGAAFGEAELVPLKLMIEAQNRTRQPMQITGAYLDVAASVTDVRPALQLSFGSGLPANMQPPEPKDPKKEDPLKNYARYHLENFGWGAAENVVMRYDFSSPDSKAAPTTYRFVANLGTIEMGAEIDMVMALSSVGVDVRRLSSTIDDIGKLPFDCRSRNDQACLALVRASRAFGSLSPLLALKRYDDIVVGVIGVVEYSWRNNSGERIAAVSPFKLEHRLASVRKEDSGIGEGADRTIVSMKAQELLLDKERYRLPVAFSAPVAAGRSARLELPIRAARSSRHQFHVVVQLADGREVRSRPIDLVYYRPRWVSDGMDTFDIVDLNPKGPDLRAFEIVGTDLRQLRSTDGYACDTACQKDKACRAYSANIWSRTCLLKSEARLLRFDPKYSSGLKEGTALPPQSTEPRTVEHHRGGIFPDLREFTYKIEMGVGDAACERMCMDEKACVAFTVRKPSQVCHLLFKTGAEIASGQFSLKPDATADSGVKLQLPR